MTFQRLAPMRKIFARWIDAVADVVADLGPALTKVRTVRLVEQPDGSFALFDGTAASAVPRSVWLRDVDFIDGEGRGLAKACAGAQLSLVLGADHFVVRDLELPGKAAGFLPGVIRAQLDRLTPWTPTQAAFGFRQIGSTDAERIHVTVAATARALVDRFMEAGRSLRARSIAVFADVPGDGGTTAPIRITDDAAGSGHRAGARRAVVAGAAAAVVLACGSVAGASLIGAHLATRQAEVDAQTIALRRSLQAGPVAAGPAAALHRQKRGAPSATLTLEALARLLPDDTFLTDLEMRSDVLAMSGLTPDAAKIVRLLGEASAFAGASFTAPTTRVPGERGERFQIEVRLKPPALLR